MNYTEKNRGRNRPFHSSSTDAGMRIRRQSLLDNRSWKLSWCIDIRYDSNGKQDQTPAKWLNSDTSAVRVHAKECSWLTLPVRELLCLTAFLHPHPSPREGWWYQSSLSAGSRLCFPCLCSFPVVPEQTGLMAPGRQQGSAGMVLELDLYHRSGKKNQGSQFHICFAVEHFFTRWWNPQGQASAFHQNWISSKAMNLSEEK